MLVSVPHVFPLYTKTVIHYTSSGVDLRTQNIFTDPVKIHICAHTCTHTYTHTHLALQITFKFKKSAIPKAVGLDC